MIGTFAFLGRPLTPWQVLQTRSLAPRIFAASASFPGVGTAGISTACSAGNAGAASAARTNSAPKTVETQLLIMLQAPSARVPISDARNALEPPEACRSQDVGARCELAKSKSARPPGPSTVRSRASLP